MVGGEAREAIAKIATQYDETRVAQSIEWEEYILCLLCISRELLVS